MPITARYDAGSEILYICVDPMPTSELQDRSRGLAVRVARGGLVVGVTLEPVLPNADPDELAAVAAPLMKQPRETVRAAIATALGV